MSNLMKSHYGTVSPYTRHALDCDHARSKNGAQYNGCSCPKWLYKNIGGKRTRKSLVTTSWPEAMKLAADEYAMLDPEKAEARAAKQEKQKKLVTVEAAADLWISRTRTHFGEGATVAQYRSLLKKLQAWCAREGLIHISEITSAHLQMWYSSTDWTAHSEMFRKQRWGILRSVFSFLVEQEILTSSPIKNIKSVKMQGNLTQGPYTREQITRLFHQIDISPVPLVAAAEQPVYRIRLRTLMGLLLHTGCDVIDAVKFEMESVEEMEIGERTIHVFRYRRTKTGQLAVVPLQQAMYEALRDVPYLKSNPTGMPFRGTARESSDVHGWTRKIGRLLKDANITHVEIPVRDNKGRKIRKPANIKMLRHTFAVRQLEAGLRLEEVSKMMGHANTNMIRKHYAPWVESLDRAHVERVISTWN